MIFPLLSLLQRYVKSYLTTRHDASYLPIIQSNNVLYCTVLYCTELNTTNTISTDGIAATTSGFDCIHRIQREWDMQRDWDEFKDNSISILNCTVIKNGIAEPCRFARYMPGSNLYFACWACLLSSLAVALKWKVAKVLKFAAQSQAERDQQQQQQQQGYSGVDEDDDDDGGDDTR